MSAWSESAGGLDQTFATLWETFREEMAPYPGRLAVVGRIVLSSVVLVLLVMTFRIPGAALGGYYTLLLSRESPRATLAAALELIISFGSGLVYVLVSSLLFFGSPVLHFLWVLGSFLLIFYVIRVLHSYTAAAGFGFLIATCIPIWDRLVSGQISVEATLWTVGNVALGAVVTVGVEYLLSPFQKGDMIEEGLTERWSAAQRYFLAADAKERHAAKVELHKYAAVGVSRLRRVLLRSSMTTAEVERQGALISITEHLVDLVAAFAQLTPEPSPSDQEHLLALGRRISRLRVHPTEATYVSSNSSAAEPAALHLPLLPRIETTVARLEEAIQGSAIEEVVLPAMEQGRPSIWRADAFSNPEHVKFALKGCLAAGGCYVIYNAIGWQGLNTSVATCMVTALSSVGSSRQKQLLRILGALAGGVVLGMGSQILILPWMDSITAFTLFFAAVTAIAAWISTGSARISYFGLQIALAFYLINLQEPAFQTSLTIARDRVMGILLGLVAMWLVFDLIGGVRAADQMLIELRRSFLLMAQLQELSDEPDPRQMLLRTQEVREELISSFAAINTEGDAVLFETGQDKAAHLELRDQILAAQPEIRNFLLLQVAVLQYRRDRPISDLPPAVGRAQTQFDHAIALHLRAIANGEQRTASGLGERELDQLRHAIYTHYEAGAATISSPARSLLSLFESMVTLLRSLETGPVARALSNKTVRAAS